MGKKGLFFIKKIISIFPGQCPQCATMSLMCNTFLGSLGVAHWGTTGVFYFARKKDLKMTPNDLGMTLEYNFELKIINGK
jgi:hypothetical protein